MSRPSTYTELVSRAAELADQAHEVEQHVAGRESDGREHQDDVADEHQDGVAEALDDGTPRFPGDLDLRICSRSLAALAEEHGGNKSEWQRIMKPSRDDKFPPYVKGLDGKVYPARAMCDDDRLHLVGRVHDLHHDHGLPVREIVTQLVREFGIVRSVGTVHSWLTRWKCGDCSGVSLQTPEHEEAS